MTENLYFDLNESDNICDVSSNWDSVAEMQSGQAFVANSIIGNSVWPYISGAGTQEFFADLFAKVRAEHRSVRLPYRCDARMLKRYFEMVIRRLPNGNLRIAHEEVEGTEEAFSVLHLHDSEIDGVCSICLSVKRSGFWRDDYFSPRGAVAHQMFTVCPTCRTAPQSAAAQ